MPRRIKDNKVEPIPTKLRKEWNQLIKDTKEVVARQDATVYELIALAGQVETKYGEKRIERWADEAGISLTSARQYKWLYSKGVTPEFVKKYARTPDNPNGLSYTVIREIAGFAGNLTSPQAKEYLDWAVEHKATAIAIRGYMYESIAPQRGIEEAHKSFKAAIQTKQQAEGFDNYIKSALERIIEEHPELEQKVLETTIVNADDLHKLKVQARILDEEEQKIVDEAKKVLDKLKRFRKYLNEKHDIIKGGIEYGHEWSPELKAYCGMIAEMAKSLSEAEIETLDETNVIELEAPKSKTKSFKQ